MTPYRPARGPGARRFLRNRRGTAAIEFALVLPTLLALVLGTLDVGQALWLGRKLVSASQTMADHLAREDSVNDADIREAELGAQMILAPFEIAELGYDVAGIQFDTTTNNPPRVRWRRTARMDVDDRLPQLVAGLGGANEGVIVVIITYRFRPTFYGWVLDEFEMRETAVLRGRTTPYIPFG